MSAGGSLQAAEPTMRVRIEWGGGTEHRWEVTLAASKGTLSNPQSLGIEADEPGSVWVDEGRVESRAPSGRVYDGVDVTIAAPADAKLQVEIGTADVAGKKTKVEIPLAQLIEEYHNSQLDDRGNRLLARRVPGDRFKLEFKRDSFVFAPGETFEFEVQPNLLVAAPGTKLRLQSRLVAAHSTRALWPDERAFWSEERELIVPEPPAEMPVTPLSLRLPDQEGVYDLILVATRRGLQDRLGLRNSVDERKIQLVVCSPTPPAADAQNSPPLEMLIEIDPANPAWWERLGTLPRVPGLRKGPLGNGDLAPWQHSLGTLVQLGPGGREPDISWEAYPLPVSRPGQPHILEIEYPSDVPQSLGISIVEPNAAGAVMPIGLDSGIYSPAEAAENPPALVKHRLVFWPRTTSPLVLMTNRRHGSRAVYGKIRLLGPKVSSFPTLNREPAPASHLPRAFVAGEPTGGRLLAAYYDRPLFPENFSANQGFDAWSGQSGRTLDDWNTFYEGASRLVEYLHFVGYNGLMLSVLADGSTIYPTQLLEPSPRYDDGIFFATAQDPVRKDVLELLFRMFDREKLQLVPALQFSAPLPELEAIKRTGGAPAVGIELVGADGKTWTATHTARQGLAPYYNPLNERVQSAMLAAVHELCQRYSKHASFAGLALQLSADGYAQLPGAEWGYDDDTLSRFSRATKLDLGPPGKEHIGRRTALLAGEYRAAWLHWRSEEMAKFYRQLQAETSAARSGARLYMAAADMLNRPEFERELRPSLPKTISWDEVLQSVGFSAELSQARGDMVLMRPSRLAPLNSLSVQAVNLELNPAPELDRTLLSNSHPTAIFFHERQEARLASFDAKSPFRKTYTRLVAQPCPAAAQNRRRFVHALTTLDALEMYDGGWLLPMGQEEELRDFVAAYRRLPVARFQTLPGITQPVVVRTHTVADQTYIYVVNDSPWKATLTLAVSAPNGCRLEGLGSASRFPALEGTSSDRSWTVDLAPYDLVAGVFSSARVKISDPRVRLQGQVDELLDARIKDLWARAAALKSPPPIEGLANPDFEMPVERAGLVPGWDLGNQAGATLTLDNQQPEHGKQSLKLVAGPAGAELRGKAFATPQTGRVSMKVWLRVEDEKRQPALRLGLQCRVGRQDVFRYATLGVGAGNQKLSTQWAEYEFQLNNLPAEEFSQLRLRFDMSESGEVWIDDVQLYDLEFSDIERLELSKIITLVEYKRKSGELGDCVRLLEGYWPQFLVSNVALTQQPLAQRAPRPAATPADATLEADKRSGVLDRFRRALPDFLR
jgi:hypothetical protein